MIKVRKLLVTTVISAMLVSTSVGAMGLWQISQGRDGLKVYILGTTTSSVKTNTTDYGLKKNKYVKKLKIRLVEGDYDKSKSTTDGTIKISKKNNPFNQANGSWTWYYKK